MFDLILENENGDQLTFSQNSPFTISDIQGLNPPEATINTSQLALIDGAKFNSSKLNMRTINIAFAIEYQAAANRIEVYKVLKSKQYIKLYYNGDYRKVFIEGYISNIDIAYFEMKQIVTCSILCPSPYFKEAEQIVNELLNVISSFHFPFASEGGKNLIPFPYFQSDRTDAGLTWTVNSDGSVNCNGTNEASVTKAFIMRSRTAETFYLGVGTYILSGGISATQRVIVNYQTEGSASATTLAASSGSDVSFTVTDEIAQIPLQVGIYISSGEECDDLTFYPMIRFSSYQSDAYQPYGYGQLMFGYISNDLGITIENDGDVECGMTITLYASEAVSNPKIFNYVTGEFIGLNFSMQKADQIIIDTRQGQKTVTLIRGGVKSNIFNSVIQGSTWLQLPANGGTFVYEVQSGSTANLTVSFSHFNLYEGV